MLGVLSNASRKDIERNKSQIKAFAKVGKTPSFPYDFEDVLGKVERTEESLNDAVRKLSFDKDKVAYGLFWFTNATFVDEETLSRLKENNLGSARTYLRTCGEQVFSTYINMGCLCLASGNWGNAAYSFVRLFDSKELWTNYVTSITDNPQGVSYEEELELFVENLLENFPSANWLDVFHRASFMVIAKDAQCSISLRQSAVYKTLLPKCLKKITSAIDTLLDEASEIDYKDVQGNLNMAAKLEQSCKELLASLKIATADDEATYSRYADKVAMQTLENGVHYYINDKNNPDCPKNILRYVRFCVKIAEGQIAKDRAKKNFDVIKEAYDNMCPQEVREEVAFIEKQMKENFNGGNVTHSYIFWNSIRTSQAKLNQIKQKIGENEKFYWRLSERLVVFYLNNIIVFINEATKAYNDAPRGNDYREWNYLSELLKKCKPIMHELESFPQKDADAISKFNKNYQTFKEICQDYHIDEPNSGQAYSRPVNPRPSTVQQSNNSSTHQGDSKPKVNGVKPPIGTGVHSSSAGTANRDKSKFEKVMTDGEKVLMGISALLTVAFFCIILIISSSGTQQTSRPVANSNAPQNAVQEPSSEDATSTYTGDTSESGSAEETYDVTYYDTGDRPYIDYYGKGNYDRRTKNSLKIENGSESDAVVFLVSFSGKKVRHVYIKKGEHFKMIQIPGGKYIIRVYQGNFWNAEKYNGDNAPYGGFMEDVSMSKSDRNDPFDYPYPKSGRYYEYEVTLYKVANGNFSTEHISEEEMFN